MVGIALTGAAGDIGRELLVERAEESHDLRPFTHSGMATSTGNCSTSPTGTTSRESWSTSTS